MAHRRILAAALLAAFVAGCGKSAPGAPAQLAGTAPPHAVTADKNTPAGDVARAARADLHCPADVATPARAADAPVDDIQGVRLGLTFEEAWNAVLCTNDMLVASPTDDIRFQIQDFGQKVRQGFEARFAEPKVVRSSKQIVQEMQDETLGRGLNRRKETLQPGQSTWFVGTMGVPGQERVLRINREERFGGDSSPTVDSVAAALRKKYGPTTHESTQGPGVVSMTWAYDGAGRLQSADAPLGRRCHGVVNTQMPSNITPDCGVVVEALLLPQTSNTALVERLQVGLIDQAGANRLLERTEQALAAADQQRRSKEVNEATKKVNAPSL